MEGRASLPLYDGTFARAYHSSPTFVPTDFKIWFLFWDIGNWPRPRFRPTNKALSSFKTRHQRKDSSFVARDMG